MISLALLLSCLSTGPAPAPEEEAPEQPEDNAIEHLVRAQALEAAGDLASAEAEVSVAVALDPDDPALYLERAQIRVKMAEQIPDTNTGLRRNRAAVLREAAVDVTSYLEHATLSTDSRTWFQARRDGLLRDADALDPPPEPAPPPVEPVRAKKIIPAPTLVPEQDRGIDRRGQSRALVATGAVLGAAAAGLASASLQIRQACGDDGLCSVTWQTRPAFLAPAAVATALSSSALVLGVASAPALARPRVRRTALITTITLGSTAAMVGAVTGGLARARWVAPLSPSADGPLGTTQALANTSAASFALALPLMSAALTAWLHHRAADRLDDRVARRGRRSAAP